MRLLCIHRQFAHNLNRASSFTRLPCLCCSHRLRSPFHAVRAQSFSLLISEKAQTGDAVASPSRSSPILVRLHRRRLHTVTPADRRRAALSDERYRSLPLTFNAEAALQHRQLFYEEEASFSSTRSVPATLLGDPHPHSRRYEDRRAIQDRSGRDRAKNRRSGTRELRTSHVSRPRSFFRNEFSIAVAIQEHTRLTTYRDLHRYGTQALAQPTGPFLTPPLVLALVPQQPLALFLLFDGNAPPLPAAPNFIQPMPPTLMIFRPYFYWSPQPWGRNRRFAGLRHRKPCSTTTADCRYQHLSTTFEARSTPPYSSFQPQPSRPALLPPH